MPPVPASSTPSMAPPPTPSAAQATRCSPSTRRYAARACGTGISCMPAGACSAPSAACARPRRCRSRPRQCPFPSPLGTLSAAFVLTTSDGGPLLCPITVAYGTQPGTAAAGADYTAQTGTLTFAAGSATQATQSVSVPIVPDGRDEEDETFSVTISARDRRAVGAVVALVVTAFRRRSRADPRHQRRRGERRGERHDQRRLHGEPVGGERTRRARSSTRPAMAAPWRAWTTARCPGP